MKTKRLLPVAVVVAAAIGVHEFGNRRMLGQDVPLVRSESNLAWEAGRVDQWNNLKYCQLNDLSSVRQAVDAALSPKSEAVSYLTDSQTDELRDVVTRFLYALGASDRQQYLERIEGIREIPETPYEHPSVPLKWKMMTGSPMPAGMSFDAVFDAFWAQSKPRPVAVSLGDSAGYSIRVGEWSSGARTKWKTRSPSEHWQNPKSASLVELTRRIETNYDHAIVVSVFTILQTEEGRNLPIYVGLEWTDRWILRSAAVQLDEPHFWPI